MGGAAGVDIMETDDDDFWDDISVCDIEHSYTLTCKTQRILDMRMTTKRKAILLKYQIMN